MSMPQAEPLAQALALVIEDDRLVRSFLSFLLDDVVYCGVRFHTAAVESLAEGLAFLSGVRPEVIVLDLCLADSSGLQTLDTIRAQTTVPILIFTGLEDRELAASLIGHGAEDVIIKSAVSPRQLLWRIWRTVQRGRQQVLCTSDKKEVIS